MGSQILTVTQQRQFYFSTQTACLKINGSSLNDVIERCWDLTPQLITSQINALCSIK
jgi:hypothetical protein